MSTNSLFVTALREANDPRAWEQLKILRSLTDALDLGYLKRATEKKGADNFNGGRIWRDSLPNMDASENYLERDQHGWQWNFSQYEVPLFFK